MYIKSYVVTIKISIVIPVYNEEKYIKECIESILHSDLEVGTFEVLLVDGISTDGTRKIIQEYQSQYDFLELIDNPDKIVPKAMNLAIAKASGEYIVRLDAHSKFPKDYFSKLLYYSQKLNADNVGAVVVTEVKSPNPKSNSIKSVLSHKLGVGNSDFRVGVDEIKEVDTVPFGCYKKEVFQKYGYYGERLVRNQDIEFNKRITNGGGKIYLIPDVKCTYFARENFTDLSQNNYDNGYWNILTAYYTKTFRSLGLRHFVPLFFVLSLVVPVLASLFYPSFLWISVISLASYLTLVIIVSLKIKNNTNSVKYLIMSFITLHLSYGWGSFMGIFAVLKKMIKGEK